MKLPIDATLHDDGKIYLKGIDLEDTWLLAMHFDNELNALSLKVDLSIWPDSNYYRAPLPKEWTCYRKAEINFVGIKEISGLFNLEDIKPSTDQHGEKDWDCIYGLRMEAPMLKFEICGRGISLIADAMELIVE